MSGLAIPGCARAFVFRLRGFRGAAGAQGLRRLNRSNHFDSTLCTSLSGRPDSFDSPSLAYCHQANICACGGVSPYPSNRPHPVRRLPRPTALPAHILRDSVRYAPRDSQDVEPTLTDARFRVLPGKAGITRSRRPALIHNYSGKFVNFVSQVWGLSRDSLACLIYTPLMVPPSSL